MNIVGRIFGINLFGRQPTTDQLLSLNGGNARALGIVANGQLSSSSLAITQLSSFIVNAMPQFAVDGTLVQSDITIIVDNSAALTADNFQIVR